MWMSLFTLPHNSQCCIQTCCQFTGILVALFFAAGIFIGVSPKYIYLISILCEEQKADVSGAGWNRGDESGSAQFRCWGQALQSSSRSAQGGMKGSIPHHCQGWPWGRQRYLRASCWGAAGVIYQELRNEEQRVLEKNRAVNQPGCPGLSAFYCQLAAARPRECLLQRHCRACHSHLPMDSGLQPWEIGCTDVTRVSVLWSTHWCPATHGKDPGPPRLIRTEPFQYSQVPEMAPEWETIEFGHLPAG